METGLAGRGVLVTGGSGGIGAAVVRALAGEGADVAVHYRSGRERAEALAAEVGGAVLGADLTVEAEADGLVPAAVSALGRLDVLVANAGMWPREDRPLWELPLERWRATLRSNLDITFLSCRAFLRHVAVTGRGSIVIVS